MIRAFVAFVVTIFALAIAPRALAYTPPPMTAHVTDTAHKLTEPERIAIDRKLEDYRLRTSNEIAVFIPASLEGEDIADVGHATGRAWKLGEKGKDNGVLLIIAPVERKARIEVGKGAEGSLTDLQSNDIIRQKIRPRLTPGSENYRAAVDDATDAIMTTLDAGGSGTPVTHGKPVSKPVTAGDAVFGILFLLFMIAVPILFIVALLRGLVGAFSSNGRSASRGWSSGSSWSNDSSYSSGGGSSWDSGGGGGGGDSGFSGGGGDFGGGGSSDSF